MASKVMESLRSIFFIKRIEFLNPGPELDIKTAKLFFALRRDYRENSIKPKAPGRALVTLVHFSALLTYSLNKSSSSALLRICSPTVFRNESCEIPYST
jgi:hypothetical protein